MHLRLRLRQGMGLGVRVLDVAVSIRMCGWVRLGGHDPGKGREGWMDKEGRTGAVVAGMATVACIVHVNEVEKVGRDGEGKEVKKKVG